MLGAIGGDIIGSLIIAYVSLLAKTVKLVNQVSAGANGKSQGLDGSVVV